MVIDEIFLDDCNCLPAHRLISNKTMTGFVKVCENNFMFLFQMQVKKTTYGGEAKGVQAGRVASKKF